MRTTTSLLLLLAGSAWAAPTDPLPLHAGRDLHHPAATAVALRVVVVDDVGSPLALVAVTLVGGGTSTKVLTDSFGEVLFYGLGPGVYDIRVRVNWGDYTERRRTLTDQSGTTVERSVRIPDKGQSEYGIRSYHASPTDTDPVIRPYAVRTTFSARSTGPETPVAVPGRAPWTSRRELEALPARTRNSPDVPAVILDGALLIPLASAAAESGSATASWRGRSLQPPGVLW